MFKSWKWDWQHTVCLIAFVLGCGCAVVAFFGKMPPGMTPLQIVMFAAPVVVLACNNVGAFFKNPPNNLQQALQEGEQLLGGGNAAVKRGFVRLQLVGVLAIVGIVGLLVIAPRETVGVGATASGQGCKFWQQDSSKVAQYTSADMMCVLGAVLGSATTPGTTDPTQIALKCVPLAAVQIAQILSDLAATYLEPPAVDAGVGAAPLPYPGAPESLTDAQKQRLLAALIAAKRSGS